MSSRGGDMTEDLIFRLRKRAEIRRQIPSRKSVQENSPDRLADLLEEAANELERMKTWQRNLKIWFGKNPQTATKS
jgi:hypothetical protein